MKNFSEISTLLCQFTNQKTSFHLYTNTVIVCSLYGSLFFPTVLLNGISILTIHHSSQLKEKVCNYFILIQSAVDFTSGAIGLPLMAAHFIDRDITQGQNDALCFLHFTVGYYLTVLSVFILVGLSFERYMGINHPFIHRAKITKKRVMRCGYTLAVFFPVISFVLHRIRTDLIFLTTTSVLILIIIFMIYVYSRIFITARKHLNQSGNMNGLAGFTTETNRSESSSKRRFVAEFKLAKSCFLVVCTFTVCFLPSVCLLLEAPFEVRDTKLMLWEWAYLLSSINCCVNSIIFFWSKPVLRKEAIKLLTCKTCLRTK